MVVSAADTVFSAGDVGHFAREFARAESAAGAVAVRLVPPPGPGRHAIRTRGGRVERLMLKAQPADIGDEDDLIKKWNVESVQLMEIVIGLEELFGIQLGDDEFSIKNFRTVKNIAEVVKEKKPDA